jgi:hypothetical protein|nr:MAG TPA_asm: hypothetical protein [Caudoviricetes sp.]
MKEKLSAFFIHIAFAFAKGWSFILLYILIFGGAFSLNNAVLSHFDVSSKIIIGLSLGVTSVLALIVSHSLCDTENSEENPAESIFAVSLVLLALSMFICFFNGKLFYTADEISEIRSAARNEGYEAALDDGLYTDDDMEYREHLSYTDGYSSGFDFGFYAGIEYQRGKMFPALELSSEDIDIASDSFRVGYSAGFRRGLVDSSDDFEWNRGEFLSDIDEYLNTIREGKELLEACMETGAALDFDELYSLLADGLHGISQILFYSSGDYD